MRDYGMVSPKFWTGDTGKNLRGKPELQVAALYLMTSPHSNMIGVYYCPLDYIGKESGLGLEGASKALRSLQEGGFCLFDEQSEEVFVTRMAAYQIGERLDSKDNRCKGVARELEKVSSEKLRREFRAIYSGAFHLPGDATKKGAKVSPSKAPTKPEAGTGAEAGTEEGSSAVLQPAEPASGFAITLNDGTEHPVPLSAILEWTATFPAVDVPQELREMRAWCNANKENRKTARGIDRFIVRWLQKAQDTPARNGKARNGGTDDWTRSAL